LFDNIIAAFKVNGKHVELCRTTYNKTIKDFIRCSKIPNNTQICYIDDLYHPNMIHENIYYIKVKPYQYDLSIDVMIHRFISNNIFKTIFKNKLNTTDFTAIMQQAMVKYNFIYIKKDDNEYNVDKIITKKLMILIQKFFNTYDLHNDRNKASDARHTKKNTKGKHNNKTLKLTHQT